MDGEQSHFGNADSLITIDIGAIVANWQHLDSLSPEATETAAVVKADAYGLGAARIAPALAGVGCRSFFVMSLAEAISINTALKDNGFHDARIFALGGCHHGQEGDFAASGVIPVINSLPQLERWREWALESTTRLPAALHIDTAMTRLGLDADEMARLNDQLQIDGQWLKAFDLHFVMSHLSAGEDLTDSTNDRQRDAVSDLGNAFPGVPFSLANSGGTLRGGDFHMALTRPGIALYGLHPAGHEAANEQIDQAAKLQQVVTWQARILQRRSARAGDRVGYNGTHRLERDSRIVTLGVGYADGYPRALSNRALVEIAGETAPVVGRVSMDSITVDVTHIEESRIASVNHATILGSRYDLASMARDAGTIGYEILTQLGRRPARRHLGG